MTGRGNSGMTGFGKTPCCIYIVQGGGCLGGYCPAGDIDWG